MRLHWFSPLPPAKTGIAAYTARLLPALCQQVEITLWTDQETWDRHLEDYAEVRPYQLAQMPWVELNRGHISIYHMGNNPLFHGTIWQVSCRHPGIVVLHDLRLQNFFAGLYRDHWHDREGYVQAMTRYYGERGGRDAEAFWGGHLTVEYLREHYPLTALAVDNALGVVVHVQEGLEDLRESGSAPVVYAPLPYAAGPAADQPPGAEASERAQEPVYRLIVFGFIHINRRLDALLRALAAMPERRHFHLHVYGELWDEELVRSQIRLLGLDDVVTVHGFVSEAELQGALKASHLAVNLRYPTMGEASISQLQIWEHALPSLVTRAGWYASLPPEAVAFVRPAYEVEDIHAHLRAFFADPERFARMGMQGRRLLQERHSPEVYVKTLVELASEAMEFRKVAAWRQLLRRIHGEANAWAAPFSPPETAVTACPEGHVQHRKRASLGRLRGLSRQQVTTLLAIEEAISGQLTRLTQWQEAALSAIHQAVSVPVSGRAPGMEAGPERPGARDKVGET